MIFETQRHVPAALFLTHTPSLTWPEPLKHPAHVTCAMYEYGFVGSARFSNTLLVAALASGTSTVE